MTSRIFSPCRYEETVTRYVLRGDEGSLPRVTHTSGLRAPSLGAHEVKGVPSRAEVTTVIKGLVLSLVQTPSLSIAEVGDEEVGSS